MRVVLQRYDRLDCHCGSGADGVSDGESLIPLLEASTRGKLAIPELLVAIQVIIEVDRVFRVEVAAPPQPAARADPVDEVADLEREVLEISALQRLRIEV